MDREILSQEELNALLRGTTIEPELELSGAQKDALGEIGNITYGAASTALSEILEKRVVIDAPTVFISTQQELKEQHPIPYVIVEIDYTEGLSGSNVLILKVSDATIIADLMMGGDGQSNKPTLDQMELSAIGEAMNQMIGTACTSLATLFSKKIEIDAPKIRLIDFSNSEKIIRGCSLEEKVVVVAFDLEISGLTDSEIMLVSPFPIAVEMADLLIFQSQVVSVSLPEKTEAPPETMPVFPPSTPVPPLVAPSHSAIPAPVEVIKEPRVVPAAAASVAVPAAAGNHNPTLFGATTSKFSKDIGPNVTFQPAQFGSLGTTKLNKETGSIGLVLDVPLNVQVELGTATMKIKEILDLSPGSLIELNKVAGDPVDIYINMKLVAKGEVVVIDENFGIKVVDIVSPLERVNTAAK
ncbi:MAG TPA: flagellar motor switch phosphatase FliY [Bacillota bacterium]|nr:flagellar motor switch phosphatase FliY [Bacillota bacterium]